MNGVLRVATLLSAIAVIAGGGAWVIGLDATAKDAKRDNQTQDEILKGLTDLHKRQEAMIEALCKSGSLDKKDPQCILISKPKKDSSD